MAMKDANGDEDGRTVRGRMGAAVEVEDGAAVARSLFDSVVCCCCF